MITEQLLYSSEVGGGGIKRSGWGSKAVGVGGGKAVGGGQSRGGEEVESSGGGSNAVNKYVCR